MSEKLLPIIKSRMLAFIRLESFSGIILFFCALLAFLWANTPYYFIYKKIVSQEFLLVVNDGLMALFFCLVALEIKREFKKGSLSSLKEAMLPLWGALGGVVFPALIYVAFNYSNSEALRGWAIPTATDIAFALAVLSLFGSKIPNSLRIFLLTLAIFDDLAAILIIAIFYNTGIQLNYLLGALIPLTVLCLMNYFNIKSIIGYFFLGLILWFCVLKSGVHATIAGVMLGFLVPLSTEKFEENSQNSPAYKMEKKLHPWVAYVILPLFSFSNSGVNLEGKFLYYVLHDFSQSIMWALFLGKQTGIFVFAGLAIRLGCSKLPQDSTWSQLYGVSILGGIGFTMSLFIGFLAYNHSSPELFNIAKIGVISGSLISALLGAVVLKLSLKNKH
ncbi:MAG: Na+/H+ antiporter NhaA [Gammaproteobacteria bacterium]